MRPTRPSSHQPPPDPSPLMGALLSDDSFDVEHSFGEPLRRFPTSTGAASSSALMRRSVDSAASYGESPSRQHIEYAPSDAGSDNAVPAARIIAPHGEIPDDESDTASDYSDEDLWTAEPQDTLAPNHYLVAHTHAAPNGSPTSRTRPIPVDLWRPGPSNSIIISVPLIWRMDRDMDTLINSPVDVLVTGVLNTRGIRRNNLETVRAASRPNSALAGPPPKFLLPKGRRELPRQDYQASRAGQDVGHSSLPPRTVQVRRTKYVVPRILSRTGSFFNDDPFVTEPTPTVEQALSWSFERVLMTKEEYEQKVAAMVDKTNTPLRDNDPFAVLAQNKRITKAMISSIGWRGYGNQDLIDEYSRAAVKFTKAAPHFTMTPQLELSGIDKGMEGGLGQSKQDNRTSFPSVASGGPSNTRTNPVQAEIFATRRTSLREQLAANAMKRKEILQREQDEIDTWQASSQLEGAQLLEERKNITTAANERTELRLRVLDNDSRMIQGRLNRLNFLERGGKGPMHL